MKELLELYWTFVKIGCVTFGGGYAMLPILERDWWTNAGGPPWTTCGIIFPSASVRRGSSR